MEALRLLARPTRRRAASRRAGRECGLQQIAARRRLPVDHLAGDEESRTLPQHEALVDLTPRDAAGGRDRPGDRSGSDETKGAGLDMAASASPSGRGPASRRMLIAAGVRPAPLRRSVDVDWPGLRFNRVASVASARSGLKSIVDRRRSMDSDRFPKRGAERVDRAAFEAGARDHRLAANAHLGHEKALYF